MLWIPPNLFCIRRRVRRDEALACKRTFGRQCHDLRVLYLPHRLVVSSPERRLAGKYYPHLAGGAPVAYGLPEVQFRQRVWRQSVAVLQGYDNVVIYFGRIIGCACLICCV
jgi:hypothetical protein